MYQKYHTEALILGSQDRGEADRVFTLYTRDFGLVRARASAVRTEGSRMRYALQSGARVHVSLVRGGRGWRAVGAFAIAHIDVENKNGAAVFGRIVRLLERLIGGEEANAYLFTTLIDAHEALMHLPQSMHSIIELIAVARMLYALGYLSAEALGTSLFAQTAYTSIHLEEAEVLREKLLASVNHAIAETHL